MADNDDSVDGGGEGDPSENDSALDDAPESESTGGEIESDTGGSAGAESEGEIGGDTGGAAGDGEPDDGGDPTEFDPGLIREFADDLKRVDIRVLSAIRDINRHPENYDDEATAPGQMPANTMSVRQATGLSKRQVEYRLARGERGWEEWGPNGLLNCYDPELTQTGGMGPRSAELTELGQQVLAVAKGEEDAGAVDPRRSSAAITAEEFQALQESVDQLAEQMEEIAPLVDQWADREWGAVNQDQAGKASGMFKTVIQLIQTFQALGVDQQVYADDAALAREEQAAVRERIVEEVVETAADEGLLGDLEAGGGAGSGGDVGGQSPGSAAEADGGGSGGSGARDGAAESEPADEDVLEPDAGNEPSEAAGESGEAGDGDSRGLDEFGDGGDGR